MAYELDWSEINFRCHKSLCCPYKTLGISYKLKRESVNRVQFWLWAFGWFLVWTGLKGFLPLALFSLTTMNSARLQISQHSNWFQNVFNSSHIKQVGVVGIPDCRGSLSGWTDHTARSVPVSLISICVISEVFWYWGVWGATHGFLLACKSDGMCNLPDRTG